MYNEANKYIATVYQKPTIFDRLLRRQPTVWLIAHCDRLVSIDRVGDALHFFKKEKAEACAANFAVRHNGYFVPDVMKLNKYIIKLTEPDGFISYVVDGESSVGRSPKIEEATAFFSFGVASTVGRVYTEGRDMTFEVLEKQNAPHDPRKAEND